VSAAKTLALARRNPTGVRFLDLITLIQALGFVERRGDGSHRFFKHPTAGVLNVQPRKDGKAKPYQVRQLLAAVDAHGLTLGEDEA